MPTDFAGGSWGDRGKGEGEGEEALLALLIILAAMGLIAAMAFANSVGSGRCHVSRNCSDGIPANTAC